MDENRTTTQSSTERSADEVLARFERGFRVVDDIVDRMSAKAWGRPSPNPGWAARDVLDHLVWGQRVVRAFAAGDKPPLPDLPSIDGILDRDLVAAWNRIRAVTRAELTPASLSRELRTWRFGEVTLGEFVNSFPNDGLLHAWDLSVASGLPLTFPEDLVAEYHEWSKEHERQLRAPGGYGPEIEVPEDADVLSKWLAFSGRDPALTVARD